MSPEQATIRFANAELARAARRVSSRLRRMKASGIYGGDYGHRTCWDEYRFEVENGSHPLLESAWDMTIHQIVVDVVERLPDHLASFLSWQLASFDENEPEYAIRHDLLCDGIRSAVNNLAGGL